MPSLSAGNLFELFGELFGKLFELFELFCELFELFGELFELFGELFELFELFGELFELFGELFELFWNPKGPVKANLTNAGFPLLLSIPPWESHCGATQKGAEGSSLKGSYGSLETPGVSGDPKGHLGAPRNPSGLLGPLGASVGSKAL